MRSEMPLTAPFFGLYPGGMESRLAESGDGERELPRRDVPSTRAFIPSTLRMRTGTRFVSDAPRRSPAVQLPGFRVSLKTFAPGQKVVWAASAPGRLCVMMAGEMTETGRARPIRYHPADLVYKPPEERPQLSFGDGVRTVTVELARERLTDLDKAGLSLGRSFRHASATAAALGARISAELLHRDELTPMAVEGLVLELL